MSNVRVTEAERGLASLSKTVKVTDRLVPIGRLVLSAQAVMPAVVNLYAASKHRSMRTDVQTAVGCYT